LNADDGSLCEDDGVDCQTEDAGSSRSRKVSSEFSLAVSQNYGEWKSNILDKLNYSSRKGSSSNLQPLGQYQKEKLKVNCKEIVKKFISY